MYFTCMVYAYLKISLVQTNAQSRMGVLEIWEQLLNYPISVLITVADEHVVNVDLSLVVFGTNDSQDHSVSYEYCKVPDVPPVPI